MIESRKKSAAGFTLVELIVVIAILGILAGISVPVYSGYIEKANEAADLQLLGALNTAYAAACAEMNVDPTGVIGTAQLSGETGSRIVTGISASGVDAATNAGLNEAFMRYYGDNAAKPFKVYTSLEYDQENGVFTGITADSAAKLLAAIWKTNGNTYNGKESTMLAALDDISGVIGDSELLGKALSGEKSALDILMEKFFANPEMMEGIISSNILMALDEELNDAAYNDPDYYWGTYREIAQYVEDDELRQSILQKIDEKISTGSWDFDEFTEEEMFALDGTIDGASDGEDMWNSAYGRYAQAKYGAEVTAQFAGTTEDISKITSNFNDLKAAMNGKTGTELGNGTVLYIAERTAGLDASTSYSEMQEVMSGIASATGDGTGFMATLPILGQASAIAQSSKDIFTTTGMAYALATGYYNYKGTTADSPANLSGALDYIAEAARNDDFSDYMSTSGQADLAAYIAAMGAMNEKSGDISTSSNTAFSDQLSWLNDLLGNE